MKKILGVTALALALTGCISFDGRGSAAPTIHYVLDDVVPADTAAPPAGRAADAGVTPRTLLVLDTTSSGFYNNDQLVFSRTPGTRGYYQFARWTERPGKRFADLLRSRLDRLGGYRVAAASGQVRGDLLLDTELIEFYHDARSQPGEVHLLLRADLLDLKRRTLLDRRVFEQRVPVATYDAAGAAAASGVAVGHTLDQLAAWLASFGQTAYNPERNAPTIRGESP
ncbi:putative lipoprotein [Thiobacillus denitrificans ATCC 25259]|uniref:Putative lipoprotein n=1 Tax=Thiobacillus denitrificans (strain ATCC 25259 / T1) TaxID=292415 RepID=Q3SM47_THIDA|nr:ABC-type transport auxiliary lipoprotein family protein [Thiobacillus denitrificans]AAZ96203.1 putative lipoprotein [Thiobacillus denitrificans ATCC 25259]